MVRSPKLFLPSFFPLGFLHGKDRNPQLHTHTHKQNTHAHIGTYICIMSRFAFSFFFFSPCGVFFLYFTHFADFFPAAVQHPQGRPDTISAFSASCWLMPRDLDLTGSAKSGARNDGRCFHTRRRELSRPARRASRSAQRHHCFQSLVAVRVVVAKGQIEGNCLCSLVSSLLPCYLPTSARESLCCRTWDCNAGYIGSGQHT